MSPHGPHGPHGAGRKEKPKNASKTLRRLVARLKPFIPLLVIVFIFTVAGTLCNTVSPLVLGQATTEVFSAFERSDGGTGWTRFLAFTAIPSHARAALRGLFDMPVHLPIHHGEGDSGSDLWLAPRYEGEARSRARFPTTMAALRERSSRASPTMSTLSLLPCKKRSCRSSRRWSHSFLWSSSCSRFRGSWRSLRSPRCRSRFWLR